jgi:hypothetical protein
MAKGRLTLPCQYALPVSAVIVIVAAGAGPPSAPCTALLAMSTTTTASGSEKSNATTSPVSANFGPMSGSANAVSKMPPM